MTSLAAAPTWTISDAEAAGRSLFGVTAIASLLPSERDQNFRLTTGDGTSYVLKVANAVEHRGQLEAENEALLHLSGLDLCPQVLLTVDGESIGVRDGHAVRLITFLAGRPLGTLGFRSPRMLDNLGRAVGSLQRRLSGFDHPAVHRRFLWDLAAGSQVVADRIDLLVDQRLRRSVEHLVATHAQYSVPHLAGLRRGVVHNDANDFNVLVDPLTELVTGIVDFGDMVVSHSVNDLAIACAYALLGSDDPLATVAAVTRGYHAVDPLSDGEIAALWGLVGMRLAMSVCIAVEQQVAAPDNEYLGISQGPIADAMPLITAVHPRLACYVVRAACGLPPVPHGPTVETWLRDHQAEFASPTGHDLRHGPVAPLDMSAGSLLISNASDDNGPVELMARLRREMTKYGAAVGAGGYGEARLLYAGEAFGGGPITEERRTVHVGIDLTLEAGSPLYAPLDGTVHAFENATTRYDYGPVIVLRHAIADSMDRADELEFFTLWGHLGIESLDGLYVGKPIAAGEQFASIGEAPTNGDWWPHTHFQVILDMLDEDCNMNGACKASQWAAWRGLCPDPNLILGIPVPGTTRPLASSESQLVRRRARTGGNVSVSYGDVPMTAVRGRMQYLFDHTGRAHIDAYNNVAHVGHSHPRVVEAVSRQLAVLNTNTRYLQDQLLDYADDLCAALPDGLEVCYLTASGSEANELALRLARAHTGARDLIVMEGAYHGHTTGLIDISPYKHDGPGGAGAPDWVHPSPVPDVYRGRYRSDHADVGGAYAAAVGDVIDRVVGRGRRLSGYIAETCPSVGGQIMVPTGFLGAVYDRVRAAGGVCIADEVQTGFGRIGTHFWAFEAHDVVPDIVVLGKPIANGYPMGAVVTTRAIAESFDNGMEFFSTFGGSTAACAAAHETLRIVRDERLQAHALTVGDHLLAGLRKLAADHDLIGDVRGSGLFLGVELVRDRQTIEPAAAEASRVVRRMREMQILAGTDGPSHNVVKLRGPMPLTISDANLILDAFARAVTGM